MTPYSLKCHTCPNGTYQQDETTKHKYTCTQCGQSSYFQYKDRIWFIETTNGGVKFRKDKKEA